MLVICEDCAKKYNIDESRIKGNRARFSCKECGHIIIVNKTDVSRPLVTPGEQQVSSPSSTIDLLKELEEPLVSDSNATSADQSGEKAVSPEQKKQYKRKNRGIPVIVYFIFSVLFALVVVSLVTGYLYSEYLYEEYLLDIYNRKYDPRQEVMYESALIFGLAWMIILAFVLFMGSMVHKKFRQLVKNANQLSSGQYDIEIVKKGPREVRDMAYSLERIRTRLKGTG